MKKTLFIATVLSLIVPVHADTATQMNTKLADYIQLFDYKKGEDFILTFKVGNTVVLNGKEYSTSLLAVGDDAVWGTWTASAQQGYGFILCDPQGTNADSIRRAAGRTTGTSITFNEDYAIITDPSTSAHSILWMTSNDISPFVPDDGTQTGVEGWRIKDSAITLTYDSKKDLASLSAVLYQLDSKGKQLGTKTVTLVLRNAGLDANDLHFVTNADTGNWESPFKSSTAKDFYQTLDSDGRSWLSGLVFLNMPADSYIKTDDNNTLTGDDSGSGSGVAIVAPEGDNTITGPTLESTEDNVVILAPEGDNKIEDTTIDSAQDIIIIGENNDVTNSDLDAKRNILVDAENDNTISDTDMKAGNDITLDAEGTNDISGTKAEAGEDIIILGNDNKLSDGTDLDAKRNILVDAENDNTISGTDMKAGNEIKLDAEGTNDISGTKAEAGDDIIILGNDNKLSDGTNLDAKRNILVDAENDNTISGTNMKAGNEIKLDAEGDNTIADTTMDGNDIIILGDDNKLDPGTDLTAKNNILVDADKDNTLNGADLDAGNEIKLDAEGTNTIADTDMDALDIIIIGKDNDVEEGSNLIAKRNILLDAEDSNTVEDSVLNAGNNITLDAAKDNTLNGADLDATNEIKLDAEGDNTIADTTMDGNDIIILGDDNKLDPGADLTAKNNILVDADNDNLLNGADLDAGNEIKLDAEGINKIADTDADALDIIIIGKENDVEEGSNLIAKRDIKLDADAANNVEESKLEAGRNITLDGAENNLDKADLDAQDTIKLTGDNTIAGGSTLDADHIVLSGGNDIKDADLTAKKTVTIATSNGPGADTAIGDNTAIKAGDISIAGASPANKADITGENVTIEAKKGADTKGDIILDNVHVHDVDKPILADGGSIILRNNDDIENAELAIKDPKTAAGSIKADKGAVVNIGDGVKLDGRLTSADGSAVLNKKGEDDLLINYDDTAFNGTINMVGPDASKGKLIVTDELVPINGSIGLGAGSHTNLNGHTMVVDNNLTGAGDKPMEASLGNLNAAGSKVLVNQGVAGDRMQLSSLTLGSGSLLYVDVDPVNKVADCLSISGDLYNDGNPFLHVNNLTDPDKAEDGTRLTVLEVQGNMTGMTRDVICENGPKELNMYMEYVGNLGQLVYSSNFRTVSGGPNQNAAQEVTVAMMDSPVRPGGQLGEVLDALRHTRSTGDTLDALQALSAASNLVVPHMVMDSSRHHISNLRRYMDAPLCADANFQNTPLYGAGKRHTAWATYTGGHDHLNGDNALDAYNRNYHGAMVGYTGSVGYGCRNAVGASLGYESATGSVTGTSVKDNAIYLDLYAVTRFNRYTHRFNAGVGFHNFKVSRDVAIAAGGFSYAGRSNSTVHATSLNLGYELSRDCHYSPYTTYTPFAAVNVSVHTLGSATESGQANASVNTDYSDPVQVDLSAGVQWSRVTSSFSHNLPGKVYAALAVHAEFNESRLTAQNKFQGFAEEWKTRSQKRDTLYGEFSGGAVLPFNERWSSRAGVDFEFGADRISIGGHVGVTYTF